MSFVVTSRGETDLTVPDPEPTQHDWWYVVGHPFHKGVKTSFRKSAEAEEYASRLSTKYSTKVVVDRQRDLP